MTTRAERNKPCPSCGTAINRQRRHCPVCGTISPWRAEEQGVELDETVLGDEIEAAETPPGVPWTEEDQAIWLARMYPPPPAGPAPSHVFPEQAEYGPHVVMKDDRILIGDVLQGVKAGQVIEGHARIALLKLKGVALAPVDDAPGFVCCPHCSHVFDARRPVAPATRPGVQPADRVATLERAERINAQEIAAGARYRAGIEEEERRGGVAA
jgi:uncharacterized Zn finger protein (UPF0148 family)